MLQLRSPAAFTGTMVPTCMGTAVIGQPRWVARGRAHPVKEQDRAGCGPTRRVAPGPLDQLGAWRTSSRVRAGVATTAAKVDAVVMHTDSGTSALARKETTLLATPPGQLATRQILHGAVQVVSPRLPAAGSCSACGRGLARLDSACSQKSALVSAVQVPVRGLAPLVQASRGTTEAPPGSHWQSAQLVGAAGAHLPHCRGGRQVCQPGHQEAHDRHDAELQRRPVRHDPRLRRNLLEVLLTRVRPLSPGGAGGRGGTRMRQALPPC